MIKIVRINLINPKHLTDQHLIAEYREILMLLGHVRKHPKVVWMPKKYDLQHPILFFKDKLSYLAKRHIQLIMQMTARDFNHQHCVDLTGYPQELLNDWQPPQEAVDIIKQRIIQRINEKPDFYRYYGKYLPTDRLIAMTENAEVN